ncbi:hypothetical protein TrRE_jg11331 [Triparma retinervis]|uniref:BolA-like protein n=1 Tax=Triparma retinervis TaxID=2557542 RepID=A0A9W7L6I8_9STRA|nr:hypothetical protein TrRE_jg11331 [Triparma retinervis]
MKDGTTKSIVTDAISVLSPTSLVVTTDESDPNGSHCAVEVVSSSFEGLNTLKRQRLVYKALWELMDSGRIHAVDNMTCKTPGEV